MPAQGNRKLESPKSKGPVRSGAQIDFQEAGKVDGNGCKKAQISRK